MHLFHFNQFNLTIFTPILTFELADFISLLRIQGGYLSNDTEAVLEDLLAVAGLSNLGKVLLGDQKKKTKEIQHKVSFEFALRNLVRSAFEVRIQAGSHHRLALGLFGHPSAITRPVDQVPPWYDAAPRYEAYYTYLFYICVKGCLLLIMLGSLFIYQSRIQPGWGFL